MPKTMTPEIESLFTDFKEQRNQLKTMIIDLEVVKSKIETLFPDALTARNRFFFNEKVKTATALFSSFLEIRKEIIKSIKDEIDLRRRFELEERDLEMGDDEVRKIADKIEQLSGVKMAFVEAFKSTPEKVVEKLPDEYVRLDELTQEEEKLDG
jgi:division protein CdvB (Snf7/Vps24/ESCRT-III family)